MAAVALRRASVGGRGNSLSMQHIKNWLYQLVRPRATEEDVARREFILNILLSGSIVLIFCVTILNGVHGLVVTDRDSFERNSLSFFLLFLTLLFFLLLYFLSRRGFIRTASSLLLTGYLILAALMGYKWGVDLQAEILLFVLVIVMTGILMSAQAAVFLTLGIAIFLFGLNYLQRAQFVITSREWRTNMWGPVEVLVTVLIFGVITTVSWLSNREIGRALGRARHSESELKKERDLLEVKIEERTQELKLAQMEKMTQLYRFAEFGRLSSGLFHDLTNHLSALLLNVEQIQSQASELEPAAACLNQARRASDRMKDFIVAIRKQMAGEQSIAAFSVNEEIEEVLQVLSYKARQHNVAFKFDFSELVCITGDRTKCSQIIINLVANAIDAYVGRPNLDSRVVSVVLNRTDTEILLRVTDKGVGIPESLRAKIFEPFFTTKEFSRGTGLGLSLSKRIIEKDFSGTITVESEEGLYTTFSVTFPLALYVEQKITYPTTAVSQTTAAG